MNYLVNYTILQAGGERCGLNRPSSLHTLLTPTTRVGIRELQLAFSVHVAFHVGNYVEAGEPLVPLMGRLGTDGAESTGLASNLAQS
jgi:hypothetical protein